MRFFGDIEYICTLWINKINYMKKTLLIIALGVLMCSCSSNSVKISGRLLGLGSQVVYLEKVSGGETKLIDSVSLASNGDYGFEIGDVAQTPMLYNIVYSGERIPLLLKGGERVTVNTVGSPLRNYTVEGSKESELLREFNNFYVKGVANMAVILEKYSGGNFSELDKRTLMQEYTHEYRMVKREQLRFIIEHKDKIAAIYALYQRLPNEKFLFSNRDDIIYFRTVADAIEESYPESPFLPTLRTDIARMEAHKSLVSQIKEVGYPDFELPDMYGEDVRLSSLAGKVVLLSFWSASSGRTNNVNADLKEIYERFADRGFEVYQVGIESSKAVWINTVQEQKLPWISVGDLRGENSPVLGMYNVKSLPANFLIDRDGNIVAKNVYGKDLELLLDKLVLL